MNIINSVQKEYKNLTDGYTNYIKELKADFEEIFDPEFQTETFLSSIQEILEDSELLNYSPEKFFWINLIESLFTLEDLIDSESEDDILFYFEESEHGKIYFDKLESGLSIVDAAIDLHRMQENSILSFYYLHLYSGEIVLDHALHYQIVPELGEAKNTVHRSISNLRYEIKEQSDHIQIRAVSNDSIEIEEAKGLVKYQGEKTRRISLDEDFQLISSKLPEQRERLNKAIARIKSYSPLSYDAIRLLSKNIVPTSQEEIVSYSIQSLPAYSVLNLYNRDDIDLMDDLVHENGHHFLNVYLNLHELIYEDDEKIFYSPWRDSLRPIRGVYHAYCTFAWAFNLFSDLLNYLNKFEDNQQQKIIFRTLEEHLMLNYTYLDLLKAKKLKKVTEQGLEIVEKIKRDLIDEKVFDFEKNLSSLNPQMKSEIERLKAKLIKNKKEYKIKG